MSILDMIQFLCAKYNSDFIIYDKAMSFRAETAKAYEFPENVLSAEARIRYMYRDPIHHTPDDIPGYAHVMTIEEFTSHCESRGFINYDGFGRYVKDGKEYPVEVYPSHLFRDFGFDKRYTHVAWYNK